jgi:hypothetical protein
MTAALEPDRRTWSTWAELLWVITAPANVTRSVSIALVIGTLFVTMNQLELILSGHATLVVWLKAGLTYVTPLLIVSNLGILSATHRPGDA